MGHIIINYAVCVLIRGVLIVFEKRARRTRRSFVEVRLLLPLMDLCEINYIQLAGNGLYVWRRACEV